jgi:hypothetical protein
MDIPAIMQELSKKRKIFHSEADFQFALAWEIQSLLPCAEIRLEYHPCDEPYKSIDIVVRLDEYTYPIELKYKTKEFEAYDGEGFKLKEQSAQDVGRYDFIKDICRIEKFSGHIKNFKAGYVIFLTNDQHYWDPLRKPNVGYAAFTVHDGVVKKGSMKWGDHLSAGTTKGRNDMLTLTKEYTINWIRYSDFGKKNGLFRYTLISISS